jgi:hypothetical protein
MLICYYLGAVLMLSDGAKAIPLTSGNSWYVTERWGTPYLEILDSRGNQKAFELDSSYAGMTVDMVLLTCDEQAKQPQIHP